MKAYMEQKKIIHKYLDELPSELIQEVKEFIEFLKYKKQLSEEEHPQKLLILQQESLNKIWESEAEDLYEV